GLAVSDAAERIEVAAVLLDETTHLREEPTLEHGLGSGVRTSVNHLARPTQANNLPVEARVARGQRRHRSSRRLDDLERADDAPRVPRIDTRRRGRIDLSEFLEERAPLSRLGTRLETRAELGLGRHGGHVPPLEEGPDVLPRTADHERQCPSVVDLTDEVSRSIQPVSEVP